jgi:hypothetical protein
MPSTDSHHSLGLTPKSSRFRTERVVVSSSSGLRLSSLVMSRFYQYEYSFINRHDICKSASEYFGSGQAVRARRRAMVAIMVM